MYYILFAAVIILMLIVIVLMRKNSLLRENIETSTESKKTSFDVSMLPANVTIDPKTLLPQTKNKEYGYGRQFNAFVSSQGNVYHKSRCRFVKGKHKQLIHRYIAYQKYTPCQFCKPRGYIDKWYIQFLKTNFGIIGDEAEIEKTIKNAPTTRYALDNSSQLTLDLPQGISDCES